MFYKLLNKVRYAFYTQIDKWDVYIVVVVAAVVT